MVVLPLLAALVLVYALAVRTYAKGLIRPPRMSDGKALARLKRMSPADLGLAYDAEQYPRADRLQTPAWWVPLEGSRKTAILLHGYADAKVGALAWAPLFRTAGYNLLLPDLRAHGEAPDGPMTAGVREAEDLALLLDELSRRHPGRAEEVLLFGPSLAAAAATRLLSHPDFTASTAAVTHAVLDSPPATFLAGATAHARLMSLPGPWLTRPGVWLAEKMAGVRFTEASVLATLPDLRVPVLLILPTKDSFIPPADHAALVRSFENHRAQHPGAKLWMPEVPHLLAISQAPTEYEAQVRELVS